MILFYLFQYFELYNQLESLPSLNDFDLEAQDRKEDAFGAKLEDPRPVQVTTEPTSITTEAPKATKAEVKASAPQNYLGIDHDPVSDLDTSASAESQAPIKMYSKTMAEAMAEKRLELLKNRETQEKLVKLEKLDKLEKLKKQMGFSTDSSTTDSTMSVVRVLPPQDFVNGNTVTMGRTKPVLGYVRKPVRTNVLENRAGIAIQHKGTQHANNGTPKHAKNAPKYANTTPMKEKVQEALESERRSRVQLVKQFLPPKFSSLISGEVEHEPEPEPSYRREELYRWLN